MSKLLLLAMSFVEFATGAALLVAPSQVVEFLLGNGDLSPALLVLARVMGAALISIGVACWLAKNLQPVGRAALIRGMLIYNLAVPALLAYAAISFGIRGLAFWPGCVVHSGLSIWCMLCFQGH